MRPGQLEAGRTTPLEVERALKKEQAWIIKLHPTEHGSNTQQNCYTSREARFIIVSPGLQFPCCL